MINSPSAKVNVSHAFPVDQTEYTKVDFFLPDSDVLPDIFILSQYL